MDATRARPPCARCDAHGGLVHATGGVERKASVRFFAFHRDIHADVGAEFFLVFRRERVAKFGIPRRTG